MITAGCAGPTAQVPVAAPQVAAGQARIWLYRDWQPSESLNLANIDANGSYFGSVANGSAFYRDVPAGHYHIAPESYGRDANQDRNVDLASGQQLYVKIVSLESWSASVSSCKNCARDSFYAWLIPPEVAQVEIAAKLPRRSGSSRQSRNRLSPTLQTKSRGFSSAARNWLQSDNRPSPCRT